MAKQEAVVMNGDILFAKPSDSLSDIFNSFPDSGNHDISMMCKAKFSSHVWANM